MQSIMQPQHNFAQAPSVDVPRSVFNRSHGYKTTFSAGYITPILMDEVLPGDSHILSLNAITRMISPLSVPIVDNMYMDFHFFFCPMRLVWDNFEEFMGYRTDADVAPSKTIPTITGTNVSAGTLWDYFGLPVEMTDGITVNSLPFRAYNLIYNTWYKSESLQDDVTVDLDDGPDTFGDYSLLKRCKRHDYFTSCLPWLQKGTAVDIPIGTSAPITGLGKSTQTWPSAGPVAVYETGASASTNYGNCAVITDTTANNYLYVEEDTNNSGYPGIFADLSSATAATINELRDAFQIQKYLERDARGGTRYISKIKSQFGVTSLDARLERPEYLGGGTRMINISPVTQTSESGTTKQGTQAGHVVDGISQIGFTGSFTEHGYILGFVSVRADLTYQNCVNRMWSRSTIYDLYWPVFQNLGEQTVLNKEIYWDDGAGVEDDPFGYNEAWSDYRYKPSQITGLLRSEATSNIDEWHLSQDFGGSQPALGDTFIQETPPMSRVKAVGSAPDFLLDVFFNYKSVRPMPVYSVPGMIDHF